jgi:hypothetical protein
MVLVELLFNARGQADAAALLVVLIGGDQHPGPGMGGRTAPTLRAVDVHVSFEGDPAIAIQPSQLTPAIQAMATLEREIDVGGRIADELQP